MRTASSWRRSRNSRCCLSTPSWTSLAMDSATSCSARCSLSHWMASFSRAIGSTVSRSWTFWAVVRNGEYPELSASAERSSICWTRSTTCQAPRFFSQLVASALYSLTSSAADPGRGSGAAVSSTVPSTQSARPGPLVPAPMRTRSRARMSAPGSPSDRRPTCSTTPRTPVPVYVPSIRGTSSTWGLPPGRAAACAASTAARTSVSDRSSGTTMPGRTTSSSSGSTGRSIGVNASDSLVMISPSAGKLSYVDSMLLSRRMFPIACSL
ncbi:hypothetical protein SGRI78S_03584 [Streptomyces griseus subsp. griseus]